jgi:hypothetical protein
MIKRLIIPITLLLFSCSRELDFTPVNVEHELVVSATIQPGMADSLLLTSTFCSSPSDEIYEENISYKGISGAKAIVLAKGDTIGHYLEAKNHSYHYEGENFDENKEYQLKISHPEHPGVSAKTTVPAVPDFWFGTYADNGEMVKESPEANIQVLMEFDDDESSSNYYIITSYSAHEHTFRVGFPEERDSLVIHKMPDRLNSKSPIVEMTFDGSYYDFAQLNYDWETIYFVSQKEVIFSDKLFNGQKATIPIDLQLYGYKNTTSVQLTLTAISEEYYQMLRSIVTLQKNNNSFIPDPLQMYSNVQNGHGVWASMSSKTVSLDVSLVDLF